MKRIPFWDQVQAGGSGECWLWLGYRLPSGYGSKLHRGKSTTAHRIAYELTHGEIPEGMVVMHTCDNPPCCNPAHLLLGTQKDNLDDMRRKGRAGDCRNIGEDHGRCILTWEQVQESRARYAAGESQQKIADYFGVSQTQIGRIIRGESRVAA